MLKYSLEKIFCLTIPFLILSNFYILISSISLFFTIQNLSVNTSTDSLIDENLEFKINQKKLKESFSALAECCFAVLGQLRVSGTFGRRA